MARIYRAEHEGLQRQVALKVLLDGLGKDQDGHERFLREARIAAAIKHPNVVNIFDVGVHRGAPYLVMELLEGVDLESFVESKGPLDESTIMDAIIPIVAGLAAVHDAGIIHRDLKPGNIFLARGRNDELEPRLLDFGISKSINPDAMKLTSARGLLMGTPFYMSPEAARGEEMTSLSDQYALGVVLYECATGVNPFTSSNSFAEVVGRVTSGDYPAVSSQNPRLSKRMVGVIERAMHLDPSRRFSDMRAMGRELLLLAGQRTRITWGLSFSELAQVAQLARVTGHFPGGGSPRSEAGVLRPRRRRYLLPLALLALAAVTIVGFRRSGPVALAERAPVEQEGSVAALRPQPVVPVSLEPRAANVLPNAPRLESPPLVALDDAPKAEPSPEVVAEPRRVVAEQRRPRRSLERQRQTRPRAVSRAKAGATEPEWVFSTGQELPSRGPDRGTNNAPILD
jgi:serine/threonine-protein kinase